MKRRIGLIMAFCSALLISSCASDEVEHAPMSRFVLEHDGLEREYFVYLPSSYDARKDHPAVVFMHGYGGTATGTEAEVTQGLNAYAETFGWASCNDDVGFLKSLVGTVAADFAIDESSFFVSGFSNGAMMTHRIACDASELFAAVALVGGRVEPGFECMPTKALPLLQINGGNDEAVPHDGKASPGGYFFASTTSVTEHWTGSNGYCVSELQSASMPEQTICIAPDPKAEFWGSQLLFEFFDEHRGN